MRDAACPPGGPPPGIDASAVVLEDGERSVTAAQLRTEVRALAAGLQAAGTRVLATLLDNGVAWVAADLAAAEAGAVHVPLPSFFTPGQVAHALRSAGVDGALTTPGMAGSFAPLCESRDACGFRDGREARGWASHDGREFRDGCASRDGCQSHDGPARNSAHRAGRTGACGVQTVEVAGQRLALLRLPSAPVVLPSGVAKVTFTSGTTGTPKGVCLDAGALREVAQGVAQATQALDIRRHLCALPLSVLLENVAGLLAPLSTGATCIVPPLSALGFAGSSRFDAARFHEAVRRHRPHSVILLPQMLRAWVAHLQAHGLRAPASLKLVAVGGAAVGARLIGAARALGVPACEGYGLSECGSVQTLNLPGADRPGSAGRTLPHARVRVARDGEIEVAGTLFAGYVGDASPVPRWWPTGDLGHVDADGFLHLHGRKRNVLVTAYGRNVSPEWVETVLCGEAAVAHAVVLGDGRPALGAVLWPVRPDVTDAALAQAVACANATLPDYARVHAWARARAGFGPASGLATANGRPRRDAVLRLHADALGLSDAEGPPFRPDEPRTLPFLCIPPSPLDHP